MFWLGVAAGVVGTLVLATAVFLFLLRDYRPMGY